MMYVAALSLSLSILVAASPAATKPGKLSFVITVTQGEHSRDSNSSTTSITLSRGQIHYAKSYNGYRASRRPTIDKMVRVSRQDLDHLQRLLVENDLLRSRSSVSPTDRPGGYIEIDANITSGTTRSNLKLAGMREQAEKEGLFAALHALINEIEQIANP